MNSPRIRKLNPLKWTALCLLLNINLGLAAVHVSDTGTGQAAVISYYTVNNDLNTLVSVRNNDDIGKAIKVTVRESRVTEAVRSINVYLDAHDHWSMALLKGEDDLKLVTNDDSCALSFPVNDDGEPAPEPPLDYWQWETGTIQVIEMGSIDVDESGSVFAGEKLSTQCGEISAAWSVNGFWGNDPSAYLGPVSGGLSVSGSVIDVTNGFAVEIPTLMMEGFFPPGTIDHENPFVWLPDLDSGTNQSLVYHGGDSIATTWPTAYEAVSALMMTTSVVNTYDLDANFGGVSDWVISLPTLHHHTLNGPSVPFNADSSGVLFPGHETRGSYTVFDLTGKAYETVCSGICVPEQPNYIQHSVLTYSLSSVNQTRDSLLGGPMGGNVYAFNLDRFIPWVEQGSLKLHLNQSLYSRGNDRGISSSDGSAQSFAGLPIMGFAVQMFRNANAQPGLLATYATAQSHTFARSITTE